MNSKAERYARVRIRFAWIQLFLPLALLAGLFILSQQGIIFSEYASSQKNSTFLINSDILLTIWWVLFAFNLPLKYLSGFRTEHAFGLSRETAFAWSKKLVISEVLSFIVFFLTYSTLITLRNRTPETWWISGSILGILFFAVLGRLVPKMILPLFYKIQPLEDNELNRWFSDACQKIRVQPLPLFTFNLGKETRKANAAVIGLGRSRRMILSDTLMVQFKQDEIKAVVAHELGHYKNRDLRIQFGLSCAGIWAVLFLTHHLLNAAAFHGSILPLPASQLIGLMMIMQCLFFVSGPVYNAISRVMENRADHFAATLTHAPESLANALKKLGELNLADPQPSRLTELLFYDHPPIHKRITRLLR